jgi:hypothetical protein
MTYPSVLLPGGGTPERFSELLKAIKAKGLNPQIRKSLPVRKIKSVYHILQILEKSGYHTLQSSGTKCLANNISLTAIAVLVVDGNKCFFIYFAVGFERSCRSSATATSPEH